MLCSIEIKKINEKAHVPEYATPGAAGMDIYACMDSEIEIKPQTTAMIPTGIAISIPEGFAALIYARSGLATKYGIALSNGVGVIDSDYRGEVKIGLVNLSKETYTVFPGDRIAQMVITPVARAKINLVDRLDDTVRGSGGFGSTGR